MTDNIDAKAPPPGTSSVDQSRFQRIAITLGALLVAQLGTFIPLPGLDSEAVALLYQAGASSLPIPRLSVCALGVTPIFSALILAEVLMLINSSKRRLPVDAATRETFNRGILIAALFFTALQAWGIAAGLEGVPRMVVEPGVLFRTSCILSMVAATAFLAWLASLITRHGLGSGFWILLLTPTVASTIKTATTMKAAADIGLLPFELLVLPLGLFAAVVVALVALERANPGLAASGSTIWPIVLATTFASWLVLPALVYLSPEQMQGSISKLKPQHYVSFVAFGLLVPVFSLWRTQSVREAGVGSGAVNTPLMIATMLAAIMISTEYAIAKTGVYELPGGELQVMVVAVALCTLQALRASKTKAAPV